MAAPKSRAGWFAALCLAALLAAVPAGVAVAESYRYDANGRLFQVLFDDDTVISYEYDSRGNLTAISRGVVTFDLDVDGNGEAKALTDGLLILRYLFGFTDDALVAGALGGGATRDTGAQIEAHLDEQRAFLDADGNGDETALSDGLLILRYLFGFTDDALVAGALGNGATRDANAIQLYLDGLMPPP